MAHVQARRPDRGRRMATARGPGACQSGAPVYRRPGGRGAIGEGRNFGAAMSDEIMPETVTAKVKEKLTDCGLPSSARIVWCPIIAGAPAVLGVVRDLAGRALPPVTPGA